MWRRKKMERIWFKKGSGGRSSQQSFAFRDVLAHQVRTRPRWVEIGVILLTVAPVLANCANEDGGAEQPVPQAPIPVKIAQVTRGDVSARISFPGEVQPVDQVELLPAVSGQILEIHVDESEEVSAGAVLVQLETDTLAAQVRQAGANVQSAQARLTTVLQGARPQEIAASQAVLESLRQKVAGMIKGGRPEQVSAAEANLQSAQATLADLKAGPKAYDLLAAQAAVEAATNKQTSAQRNLEQLRNPTQSDIDAAQATVDSAQAALNSAQAALGDLKARPKPAEVTAGQAAVKTAETNLSQAEATLRALSRPLNEQSLNDLIDAYTEVKLARDKLNFDMTRGAPPETIAADEDAVLRAYRNLKAAEEEADTFDAGVTTEQILAAQAAVDSAKTSLESAQANLDQLLEGPTEAAFQAAQAAVDKAKAAWETARVNLQKLKIPTAADIAAAQAAVESARASLQSSQARLERIEEGATVAELAAAQAAIAKAEQNLVLTKAPFTETDIAAQQALVAQAEQQLGLIQNKYTRADVATATAGVALAEATLELANIQLEKATLVAPFNAFVSKKYVSKGALVTVQTPVLSLVSKDVQIVFNVEEGSISHLQLGLPVTFTAAAFGEQLFQGEITSISPVADPASRTFKIKVAPTGEQSALKAGMFVNVSVAVEERKNVLLVPRAAIVQQGGDSFVFVVQEEQAFQRKVEVGLSNERVSEVTSGLDEGELVVTQGNRTLRSEDPVQVISPPQLSNVVW